jgi:transposase
LFDLTARIVPIEKYAQRGWVEQPLNAKGRFILATNDFDNNGYPDARILADYKAKQTVERGFRFLKNPEFIADTHFLKSPKRIGALMMVITLCLLVHAVAQHRLRQKLQAANDTLPNQLGKPIQTPTLRWLFPIMEGIALVRIMNRASARLRTLGNR